MKRSACLFLVFLGLQLMLQCESDPGPVETIPIEDEAFLEALLAVGVDKDGDGAISKIEAESVTQLYIQGRRIENLSGIEYFTQLTDLACYWNLLSELDLSKNTKLEILDCSNNYIRSLDVSQNTLLIQLWCKHNLLVDLDLRALKELNTLYCTGNTLSGLDLSLNNKLEYLFTGSNQLYTLDLSGNPALRQLDCSSNLLDSLNLSINSEIYVLYLKQLPSLKKVCIWTEFFPPLGLILDTSGSENIIFLWNCK